MNNPFAPDQREWPPELYKNEDQLQQACCMWFDANFPKYRKMLFSVPNGGERPKRFVNGRWIEGEAIKLKGTGLQSGVSDLIFLVGGARFCEMKMPGKTQLPDQIIFMDGVSALGYDYYVFEYFEQFKFHIRRWVILYETRE